METGFTLPRHELKRWILQLGAGLALGMVLYYFQDSAEMMRDLPLLLGIIAVFLMAAVWIGSSYKYVYLSATGIRGIPPAGLKWRQVSWQESLSSKSASLNGIKGKLFTSKETGKSIFIPCAILARPDFKSSVELYGGGSHTFLHEV